MISREEIQNLAELSRLKLSEEELASLQKDFGSILEYVGQVSSVEAGTIEQSRTLLNVMREDTPRTADDPLAGKQENILSQAPKREGDYLVVRKIIDKD